MQFMSMLFFIDKYVCIYVWSCSLYAFDYIINHTNVLKAKNFNFWVVSKRTIFINHLVDCLYS